MSYVNILDLNSKLKLQQICKTILDEIYLKTTSPWETGSATIIEPNWSENLDVRLNLVDWLIIFIIWMKPETARADKTALKKEIKTIIQIMR